MGLIPVSGALVQRHDDAGFGAAKLGEQELPEQSVVSVPLPPAVERDQEQTGGLQAAQILSRAGGFENGVAERAAELIEHGRAAQEPLQILRLLAQRLAVQIVGHVPVITGDGRLFAVALFRDQSGEVEAGRPAFGPFAHRGRQLRTQADLRVGEDLLGARPIQCQVTGPELQRITRGPQPRQVRLLGTAAGGQQRPAGNPRDHHAQHVVAGGGAQLVQIVQHEHERNGASAELRCQPRCGATQHRHAGTSHVGDQLRVAQAGPAVRRRQRDQQHRGIIVETIQRHPRHAAVLRGGPLRQEDRLAIARWRGDRNQAALARTGGSNEMGAADRTRVGLRDRELGVVQQPAKLRRWRGCCVRVHGHGRTLVWSSARLPHSAQTGAELRCPSAKSYLRACWRLMGDPCVVGQRGGRGPRPPGRR